MKRYILKGGFLMAKEINNDTIAKFENDLNNHPVFNVASHAAQENGIYKASQNLQTKIDLDPTFSIEIDTGKPADQKQSGRCWMFSALNTMRHPLQKKFKLKDFELSQNYTNFWDKFEKSNWFFENVIATADKDLGDSYLRLLNKTAVNGTCFAASSKNTVLCQRAFTQKLLTQLIQVH